MTYPPARVPPAVFFATTFALSWVIWLPLMLVRLDVLPRLLSPAAITPVGLLGVLMPAVAATLLTGRYGGRAGVRKLYLRLRLWRVGRWWLPALLIQPCVLVLTALVNNGIAGSEPVRVAPGLSTAALLSSVVFLVVAAMGEELGWRGLALPALQTQSGAVAASVVLALVTATWHLPYWILQGALAEYGGGYLALNYLFFVALTFQLTWLVNHTRGSVALAVAFHVSFNIVNVAVLPVTGSTGAFALLTAAECAIALALLSRLGIPKPVGRDNQRR